MRCVQAPLRLGFKSWLLCWEFVVFSGLAFDCSKHTGSNTPLGGLIRKEGMKSLKILKIDYWSVEIMNINERSVESVERLKIGKCGNQKEGNNLPSFRHPGESLVIHHGSYQNSEIQLGQIKDKIVLWDEKRQIMIHISRKVQKICHSLFPYPPITLLC